MQCIEIHTRLKLINNKKKKRTTICAQYICVQHTFQKLFSGFRGKTHVNSPTPCILHPMHFSHSGPKRTESTCRCWPTSKTVKVPFGAKYAHLIFHRCVWNVSQMGHGFHLRYGGHAHLWTGGDECQSNTENQVLWVANFFVVIRRPKNDSECPLLDYFGKVDQSGFFRDVDCFQHFRKQIGLASASFSSVSVV